ARKTLAQILGGALLLAGLYYTAQTVRLSEKTLRVSEDRQVTERFTRAVEQLGHPSLQVRLGGIYGLERIANDSPRDLWPVIDILSAYVRDKAAIPERTRLARANARTQPLIDDRFLKRQLPQDIQTVLTVIGRLGPIPSSERMINLSATNLSGA